MGQRLNLEITKKNRVVANAYYHWSAYTGSAYELTAMAYNFIKYNKGSIKDSKLLAIRALEATGAGVPDWQEGESELRRLRNIRKYSTTEFEPFQDRNHGIISCFTDSIKETEDWAEGTVTIDLDTESICFTVFSFYDSVEDIKDWYEDFKEEDAVVFNYDFSQLSLGELTDIIDTVCSGKFANIDGAYLSEIG